SPSWATPATPFSTPSTGGSPCSTACADPHPSRQGRFGRLRRPDTTEWPMPDPTVTVLHAAGVLDVDRGDVIESGYVRVEGNRITAVTTDAGAAGDADQVIELPDLTLVPGLMDMEVDLIL